MKYFYILLLLIFVAGCTVVSANRVFPKLSWYWSKDAKMQRESDKAEKQYYHSITNK